MDEICKNKISVIIPVYKVEAYLARCLDSLLRQTYPNWEAVIVDDGSPDRSYEIAAEYAARDSRFRVIRQENGGVSAARNTGLAEASGDWFAFLDPDDFYADRALELLLDAVIKNGTQMSMAGHYWWYDDGSAGTPVSFEPRVIRDKKELHRYFLTEGVNHAYVCMKLFHRSVFQDLRFPVSQVYEDLYVKVDLLERAGDCAIISEPVYYYYQRTGSLTRIVSGTTVRDALSSAVYQTDFYKAHYPDLLPLAKDSGLNSCCLLLGMLSAMPASEEREKEWQDTVACFRENQNGAAKRSLYVKGAVLLFRVSPKLLGILCRYYRIAKEKLR